MATPDQTASRLNHPDYRVAIRDANAQGILKTFLVELSMLLHEYDMQDTIFGEKVTDLSNSYYRDMELPF